MTVKPARKNEPYLKITDASRVTGLNIHTIYRLMWNGEIPVYGRRRTYRVQVSDLLPLIPAEELKRASGQRKGQRL